MRLQYYVSNAQTPARADPQTLVQLLAGSNHRIVIPRVDVSFEDNTPASTPFTLDWIIQTDAGSGGTAITPQKKDRGYSETIQATILEYQTGSPTEPAAGAILAAITVHRQAKVKWPTYWPIIIIGAERVGLRLIGHGGVGNTIPVSFTVYCEE